MRENFEAGKFERSDHAAEFGSSARVWGELGTARLAGEIGEARAARRCACAAMAGETKRHGRPREVNMVLNGRCGLNARV